MPDPGGPGSPGDRSPQDLLDEVVGPFVNGAGAASALDVSSAEIARRVRADQVIWVPLADGTAVFPRWQFGVSPAHRERLLTVWRDLRLDADPWTAACWMCAPARALGDRTTIDYLAEDPAEGRLATVLTEAGVDRSRWRS